jgi:steroid Delta-isomerase
VPTPEEIRAIVQRYAESFSAGDKEGYVGLFADDATLEDPVGAGVHQGRDAIDAFWDTTRQMTPTIELVITGPVRVAGNEAAFPGEARPKLGDDRMVVPIVDTLAFDDEGKITQLRAFWDFADLRPFES